MMDLPLQSLILTGTFFLKQLGNKALENQKLMQIEILIKISDENNKLDN